MPAACGYQREISPSYHWDGLHRSQTEFVLWQYTLSGRGALIYEGRHYQLDAGKAMLLCVPHDHAYFLPPDSDHWEFIYFVMVGEEALRLWYELIRNNGPVGHFALSSRTVELAAELCLDLELGRLVSPLEASARTYHWLMMLMEELRPAGDERCRAPAWLAAVTRHCQAHFSEDLSLETLAAVAGCSRFHFARQFSRAQGVTPGVYVRRLRLFHAVRLLQLERLSIKEVAASAGFHDANYFCKAFRREFGVSPGVYRRGDRSR